MSSRAWDEAAFRASIPVARESLEVAARFYLIGPAQDGWESHRPVVELVLYLCRLDCNIKVLMLQFFTDPDNRMVWEGVLAQELREALQTVPQAISHARVEISKPGTRSHLDLAKFDATAAQHRGMIKEIRADREFCDALARVRNGVTAHHGFNRARGVGASIAWTLNALRLRQTGSTPFESKFGEYAVKLGRAIQDFSRNLLAQP